MRTLPLSRLAARDLQTLLDEEAEHWQRELFWDFSEVSAAVASGLDRRSLQGRALEDEAGLAGYCYYVRESGRTVVGSVFVSARARRRGYEARLVDDVLDEALDEGGDERLECQTLFCTDPESDARFAAAGFVGRARHYMVKDLVAGAVRAEPTELRLRPLRREDLPLAAAIIHRSHRRTLDAALNLTYASLAHCRSFVETLVLRSGCGHFDPGASFLAERNGNAVGVLLASRLSGVAGHICQVSVDLDAQGQGVGAALLRASLQAFCAAGLSWASLSVTVENRRAYRLYEWLGFVPHKVFAAHAWVRPPGRVELPSSSEAPAVLRT